MTQGLQVFRFDGSVALDVTERLGRVLGTITIASNTTGGSTGAQTYTISGIPSGNTLWAVGVSTAARDYSNFPQASNSYNGGWGGCPFDLNYPSAGQINYRGGYGGWTIVYGCY